MASISAANVIIPEVLIDLIQYDYEQNLVFAQLCQVDTSLEGKPGNKVSIPYTSPLTDAEVVGEGVALTPEVNNDGTVEITIAKAGKAVKMTSEAILAAAYDLQNERRTQIAKSLARQVDKTVVTEMMTTTLKLDISADATLATLNYDAIVDGQALAGEEFYAITPILIVHSKQFADLRKSPEYKDGKANLGFEMKGLAGMLVDVPVVVSDRIVKDASNNYHALLVAPGAAVLAYKRRPNLLGDVDALTEETILASFIHFGVELPNKARGVVEIITK